MRLVILFTLVLSACGASIDITTSVDSSIQKSCEIGECGSITDCINTFGDIRDTDLCSCPQVYCCYDRTASNFTTEATTISEINVDSISPGISSFTEFPPEVNSEETTVSSSTEQSPEVTYTLEVSTEQFSKIPTNSEKSTQSASTTESVTSSTPSVSTESTIESTPSPSSPSTEETPSTSPTTPVDDECSEDNQSVDDCDNWACLSDLECTELQGTEREDKENCQEPSHRCCLPSFSY
ncbi:hypothetical protein FQA39_LY11075 [Lamprigera yunnana]|nr:hypothetical protein FQA39_LY11075 [Lamprigera yunnana]